MTDTTESNANDRSLWKKDFTEFCVGTVSKVLPEIESEEKVYCYLKNIQEYGMIEPYELKERILGIGNHFEFLVNEKNRDVLDPYEFEETNTDQEMTDTTESNANDRSLWKKDFTEFCLGTVSKVLPEIESEEKVYCYLKNIQEYGRLGLMN
ncbi:hypothetical protein JTB14_023218 [Gonioctena quinquepunctata]|nr:hypothetical protein JTB14_023218 [Gonioctena quinquepunctata]